MKQLLTIAKCILWITLGMPLAVSSQTVYEIPSILPQKRTAQVINKVQVTQPEQLDMSNRSRGEATYSVTPILTGNTEQGIQGDFIQYATPRGGRWSVSTQKSGNGYQPFELAPGIYDFIFFFRSQEATYIVIREGIEVYKDMAVAASYDEAVNRLECEFTLPDGREIEPRVLNVSTETFTGGNICTGSRITSISSKDGVFSLFSPNRYEAYLYDGEVKSSMGPDIIYINPNNVIEIAWINAVGIANGPTVIEALVSENCETNSFKNTQEGYQEIVAIYGNSLNGISNDGLRGGTLSYSFSHSEREGIKADVFMATPDLLWDSSRILYKAPHSSHFRLTPILSDVKAYDYETGWRYGIEGPVCQPTTYVNVFNTVNQLPWNDYAEIGYQYLFGNPLMDYEIASEIPIHIGNTTPGIALMRNAGGFAYCEFVCRDGARRTMDELTATITIKNNGNVICDNIKDLNTYFYDEEWNPIEYEGSWDYAIESSNIKVDGKIAKSTVSLHIEEDDEDNTTPAVAQTQFRNMDGRITEEFLSLNDMELVVEAGRYRYYEEFDEVLEGWTQYWESAPVESIEVEISSPNMNGTVAVPVRLQDTVTDSDYLGTAVTYLSDLEDLDIELEDGWYDLTVRLKDGKDYCEQFIERAFKIDRSLNGVTAPMGQDNEVYVQDGRIVMPEGSRVYTIDGRQVSADAAVKGMYIVVTPRQGYRVVL